MRIQSNALMPIVWKRDRKYNKYMSQRENWRTFDEVVMDFSITCVKTPFLLHWLSNERRNNNSMLFVSRCGTGPPPKNGRRNKKIKYKRTGGKSSGTSFALYGRAEFINIAKSLTENNWIEHIFIARTFHPFAGRVLFPCIFDSIGSRWQRNLLLEIRSSSCACLLLFKWKSVVCSLARVFLSFIVFGWGMRTGSGHAEEKARNIKNMCVRGS